jgi:hypothetical protein
MQAAAGRLLGRVRNKFQHNLCFTNLNQRRAVSTSSLMERVRNMFQHHLFITNVGLSFGLSGLGDLMQQSIEQVRSPYTIFAFAWSVTMIVSKTFGAGTDIVFQIES